MLNFFCSHKFHKIAYYFSFEVLKKKIWANFQRIVEIFTKKIVNKLSKIWVWDLGSWIRKKPIEDPGSRGQKGTGSRIRIRNTAYDQGSFVRWYQVNINTSTVEHWFKRTVGREYSL